MGYGAVSLATNTAATIVTANPKRISLIITNIGLSSAFVAPDSSVTSANGIVITANGAFTEDSGGTRMYQGPFYGIAGSASTNITYWQRERGGRPRTKGAYDAFSRRKYYDFAARWKTRARVPASGGHVVSGPRWAGFRRPPGRQGRVAGAEPRSDKGTGASG